MSFRLFTILSATFCLAMTFMLVRVTYYPDGGSFSDVPPGIPLKLFHEQNTTGPARLEIYRGDTKIGGDLKFSVGRTRGVGGTDDYVVVLSGILEKGVIQGMDARVIWNVNISLVDGERWNGAKGELRFQETNTAIAFDWPVGAQVPRFTKKVKGVVVADDSTISPMLQQMLGGSSASALPGADGLTAVAGNGELLTLKAREGRFRLAGQKRKGYLLILSFMEKYDVKAYFTEAGELALAELPGGYRALEPVVYGLVPDEPEN